MNAPAGTTGSRAARNAGWRPHPPTAEAVPPATAGGGAATGAAPRAIGEGASRTAAGPVPIGLAVGLPRAATGAVPLAIARAVGCGIPEAVPSASAVTGWAA